MSILFFYLELPTALAAGEAEAPQALSSREPAPAIRSVAREVELFFPVTGSCWRGVSGLCVRADRRQGARAVRENEAVAMVEQLLEVLGPVQLESPPVGFEHLELGASETVQGRIVLHDPPEDVRHRFPLSLGLVLERRGRLQGDADLVQSHLFGRSPRHMLEHYHECGQHEVTIFLGVLFEVRFDRSVSPSQPPER